MFYDLIHFVSINRRIKSQADLPLGFLPRRDGHVLLVWLQKEIEYKAAWEGVPVVYVSPWAHLASVRDVGQI